jgi:hypothetical protein
MPEHELILKDAVADIEPGEDDEASPHGSFDVILSAPVKDRDGETLKPDEWEKLPEHITFDIDHGMSVASTVGSGKPTIDEKGNLRVAGTYASTDLGQMTRRLVNEKHIRTTSVAFLRKSVPAKGKAKPKVSRELLNGAFVAVPANPAALVLDSKSFRDAVLAGGAKEGRRNNKTDAQAIQSIHDHATTLGASCSGRDDEKAVTKAAVEIPDELRAQLDEIDVSELPEPVQQAIALLTEPGEHPDDEESSAVDDTADESAAAADADADAAAAEESAEPSAADLASALAVRARGLRVLSTATSKED